MLGVVKWFDARKGFGFIVGPDGKDVFVHFCNIQGKGFRRVRDGDTVEYDLCMGDKGAYALNVRHVKTRAPKVASGGEGGREET